MRTDWFRQCVQGLVADYPGGKDAFKGDARSLSGVSLTTLSPDNEAVPRRFSFSIEGNRPSSELALVFQSEQMRSPLIAWPGGDARFYYLDEKREMHEAWPPAGGPWPQLPAAVVLRRTESGAASLVVAVPRLDRAAKVRPPRLLDAQ